jgi:nicotinate-nucleotide adenylyltransferase
MSPKRLIHTLAVEQMTARLCALYCPEETGRLRAAALLHDTTKELRTEEQLSLCRELHIPVAPGDELSPKCFHAKTAAALIPRKYPAFAHPVVIEAVRWHTTGHEGMTLTEKLVYLADYIDESRTFEDCVTLRALFWDAHPEDMEPGERLAHLHRVLITSFDMTVRNLISEGQIISPDTVMARNDLLRQSARAEEGVR